MLSDPRHGSEITPLLDRSLYTDHEHREKKPTPRHPSVTEFTSEVTAVVDPKPKKVRKPPLPEDERNPNLSNRLPREDFCVVIPFDDRPPLMEQCAEILGDRFKERRGLGYFLDGRPASTDAIVEAAGLSFREDERTPRSPPPKRRGRRKKF